MRGRQNDGRGLVIGFIVGGVIGAALALLFAPKKGKILREDLKRKAGEWFDEAGNLIDDASDKVSSAAKEITKRATRG